MLLQAYNTLIEINNLKYFWVDFTLDLKGHSNAFGGWNLFHEVAIQIITEAIILLRKKKSMKSNYEMLEYQNLIQTIVCI